MHFQVHNVCGMDRDQFGNAAKGPMHTKITFILNFSFTMKMDLCGSSLKLYHCQFSASFSLMCFA